MCGGLPQQPQRGTMQLSEKQLAFLVEKVTAEVKKVSHQPEKTTDTTYGTVALVADILPSPEKALAHIKTKYGMDTEIYLLNGVKINQDAFITKTVKSDSDKADMMQRFALAKKVVCISPGIGMLKRLKGGDDTNFSDSVILRAILWEKDIDMVLDFEPPKYKRGTFFERVVESIDALTTMGVNVSSYRIAKDGSEGKLALVTENEIIDARNSGKKTVVCDKNAIITPLARDTARELNINIED